MRVLVLHNRTSTNATADEMDVLTQRDAIVSAMRSNGHEVSSMGCNLDLESLRQDLLVKEPEVVFNLVESLGGTDRLMSLVPQLLDALNIRYTGASAEAILATSGKITAKQRLQSADLPTAAWITVDSPSRCTEKTSWIIKPIWEHGSTGMLDDCVVSGLSFEKLRSDICNRQAGSGNLLFAEEYIDGREFNLSMLAGRVLPPAEINFCDFPEGKPHIVGQRAKWEQSSLEYRQTPRTFDFHATDAGLLSHLKSIAEECWTLFKLRGFARVDFRVDAVGRPWILEVNVNPCLSPDAGFAAALAREGITFETAIETILSQT